MIFAVAVLAASCSMEGEYTETYPYLSTFDYTDKVYREQFGSDSLYFDAAGKKGFPYYDLAFYHKVTDDGAFKGGFMLSRLRALGLDTQRKEYELHPYRVIGNYVKDERDNTYAVYTINDDASLMPETDVEFLNAQYGTFTADHCWVNNTETMYDAAKRTLGAGDKVVLKVTGYLGKTTTGTAEIVLARPDTIMYNWTKFDLTKLGNVDKLEFDIEAIGLDVPKAFCIDELAGKVNISY